MVEALAEFINQPQTAQLLDKAMKLGMVKKFTKIFNS